MKKILIYVIAFAFSFCGWAESTVDVEKYWAQFQDLYEEGDLDDDHGTLTKYAFIDIDGDGIHEVWLRTEDDEDGAIFCFDEEGEPVLIIAESEGKRPSFGKGWVYNGYPAGGPSYFNQYVLVKNSRVALEFTDFQVEESHEYYLGDTEIKKSEAKKIQANFEGEGKQLNPEWHQRAGVSAQINDTLDEIQSGWAKKTITGVKSGNILPLLTAFDQAWPTAPAAALLAHPVTNEGDEDAYSITVDTPNGYVCSQELGDDGEDIEACVWKRSNGHKLFAVVYTRYHGLTPHPIALFYDYDATKGTLTPEFDVPLVQFLPSYSDRSVDFFHIKLPQQGKDVEVWEYLMPWGLYIKQTFKWNGMQPMWSSTTIDNYDQMCRQFDSTYQLEEKVKFDKYALIDFDEDDNPELWLSSNNNDNQAIFTISLDGIQMVASTYYKTNFVFHENNVIGSAGGCGTGCFNAEYVKLDNSKVLYRFQDFQEYDYQKDKMNSTYSKDGKELSKAEGERIYKSFGEVKDIIPLMHELK